MRKYAPHNPVRLAICLAFVACLTSCTPAVFKKEALLQQRVRDYHSALAWNSAAKSSAFTKNPSLRAEILRNAAQDSKSMKIVEYNTTSAEIDEEDRSTANVTASMKYLTPPKNVVKTKETTEKWQFNDSTWFLVETDAFK